MENNKTTQEYTKWVVSNYVYNIEYDAFFLRGTDVNACRKIGKYWDASELIEKFKKQQL